MYRIAIYALIIAISLSLTAPAAFAEGDPTSDFELMGAYAGYHQVQVPLALSIISGVADAKGTSRQDRKRLRALLLPRTSRSGRSLNEVDSAIADLRTLIAQQPRGGQVNNPHWEAEKQRSVDALIALREKLVAKVDLLIRAAHKRGDEILVAHGATSFTKLVEARQDAERRLSRHGYIELDGQDFRTSDAGARILNDAMDQTVADAARHAAESAAGTPSFNGRFEGASGRWGLVTLRMTSPTRMTGTWDSGKQGRRLEGVMQPDGVTMTVTYFDKGEKGATKYNFRLTKDGKSLQIWYSYLSTATLSRK